MEPANESLSLYGDGGSVVSSLGQILLESEKNRRKLKKVQIRRDHYAKLYFQTLSELDDTKRRLGLAYKEINALRKMGVVQHAPTTSPDSGASSLSPVAERMGGRGGQGGGGGGGGQQVIMTRSQSWNQNLTNRMAWDHRDARNERSEGNDLYPQTSQHYTVETSPLQHPPARDFPPRHSLARDYPPQHPPARNILPQHPHARDCPPQHMNYLTPQHERPLPPQFKTNSHLEFPPQHIRPNFIRSQSLSSSNPSPPSSYSSLRSPLQRCSPATPLSATGHTPTHKTSLFHRSMTLPHGTMQQRESLDNRTSVSLSQDDFLKLEVDGSAENERVSAFRKPLPPPHPLSLPHSNISERKCPDTSSTVNRGNHGYDNHANCSYGNLTRTEWNHLLSHLTSPDCKIRKLEIRRSGVCEVELMTLLCDALTCNKSIVQLSLPENGISHSSLVVLLNTVKTSNTIKELKLKKNLIGQDSANLIKEFLAHTTLDNLVLTGNEIEQFGHLLNDTVSNDFSIEYSTDGSSDDSGVHTAATPSTSEPSPASLISPSFKYLRI